MRTAPEIRRLILYLRDKKQLTMTAICSRARVSRSDLYACLGMRASEDTLRRLDAFLDAPKLHERDRSQSVIAHEYEKLSRELWRDVGLNCIHPRIFESWPYEKQKRYMNGTASKGKFMLQQKYLKLFAIVVKVPDGATYWQYKTRCLHRLQGEKAIRTGDRDSRRVPWPRPILQERS